jgi:hypothetical protein
MRSPDVVAARYMLTAGTFRMKSTVAPRTMPQHTLDHRGTALCGATLGLRSNPRGRSQSGEQ